MRVERNGRMSLETAWKREEGIGSRGQVVAWLVITSLWTSSGERGVKWVRQTEVGVVEGRIVVGVKEELMAFSFLVKEQRESKEDEREDSRVEEASSVDRRENCSGDGSEDEASASLSAAPSSSVSAIVIVLLLCGLGAGGGGYFLWRRQKNPFNFSYFKNETEAIPATMMSIDNPVYSEK
ncbi:hypothetical protein N1851_010941 [Merluccius polli]|uniref:Uncharacterized protein n=1 Tax=Merluccius polli TaxID=89951 RepID=A0AA47MZ31_MERPO|nr:hypothetical protein N1851_010941 [Merluccius polli]